AANPRSEAGERLNDRLPAAYSTQIVRQAHEEQQQNEADADDRDALVDGATDRAAPNSLEQRERDVAAVERQQRQQIQKSEREADQGQDLEVVAVVRLDRLAGDVDDADRRRDVLAALAPLDDAGERAPDPCRHVPGVLRGIRQRGGWVVAFVDDAGRREAVEVVAVAKNGLFRR